MCFGNNIPRMRKQLNAEPRFEIDATYTQFDKMALLLSDVLSCLQTGTYRSTNEFPYTGYINIM